MKFSEHIKEISIPEWEDKYLNYKHGKKLIKQYKNYDSNTVDLFIDQWVIKQEFNKCESFYNEKVDSILGSINFDPSDLESKDLDSEEIKAKYIEDMFIKDHYTSMGSILLQIKIYILMMKEREKFINNKNYGSIDNTFDYNQLSSQSQLTWKYKVTKWLDDYDILPSLPNFKNFKSSNNTKKKPIFSGIDEEGDSYIHLFDDEDLDNDDSTNIMSIKTEWIWNWEKINKLLSESTYELIALLQKLEMYRNTNIQAVLKIVKKYDKNIKGANELPYIREFLLKNSKMCNDLLQEKFDYVHSNLLEDHKPTLKPVFSSKIHEAVKILSHHYTTTLALDKHDSKKRRVFLKQSDSIMNNEFNEFMVHKYNLTLKELFLSGLQIGVSLVIIIKTLSYGMSIKATDSVQHKILLPVWGGFYLIILMALLYQLNCYIWFHFKINYRFIMFGEIKPLKTNQLGVLSNYYNDFSNTDISRNLLLISCILVICCLMSTGSLSLNGMLEPYCSIFVFCILPLVVLKPQWLYPFLKDELENETENKSFNHNRHSTIWLLTPFIRLFGAFWYPVEFTDFFLGDILCSLSYSLTNLYLIYCYDYCATRDDYSQCSSSKSHLMGIISAIPNWLRSLQCWRRFLDSGDWFPHIPNGFKYLLGVFSQLALMVYRLHPLNMKAKRAFIFIAIANSIITALWDIILDFSLLQSWDKNTFGLRKTLLLCKSKNWETNKYKSWKEKSFYYLAIFEDIVLRFSWVVYFIFPKEIQQNAMTSIFIAFMEIFRRFIWIILRVENLQVTNVTLLNISIDHMKLPYQIGFKRDEAFMDAQNMNRNISMDGSDFEAINSLQEQLSIMDEVTRYYSENINILQNNSVHPSEGDSMRSSVVFPKRFRRASSALNLIHNSLPYAHSQDFQKSKKKHNKTNYLPINLSPMDSEDESDDESDRRTIHNGILLKKQNSDYLRIPKKNRT